MNRLPVFAVSVLFVAGCQPQAEPLGPLPTIPGSGKKATTADQAPEPAAVVERPPTLPAARKGFVTRIVRRGGAKEPVDDPPPRLFEKVQYDASPGKLAAYLTPDPRDLDKHPAIIWIHGGDCNSIGEIWGDAPPANDQTASQYRKAGIIMMFPSLRGGNDNPGMKEGFFGEVDDILAAYDFLAKQPYVDPARIYLGGHSTGGTLVLLVAESSDKFRAVFSFGPVSDVSGYPEQYCPFDRGNRKEVEVRSPGRWLGGIRSPTFVFEGATGRGNADELRAMARASANPKVKFFPVGRADHFTVLAPVNRLIASKILTDDGPTTNLTFSGEELNEAVGK
jgi:acetyl esterase/lipase